jgi:hypothetical protein
MDSVFVSYSRTDSRMAALVVQLLRARDDVFYDVDSIHAGERWRDALFRAIDNASHFYLLWCIHSADSPEVESEWQRAISGNKRLVPVLLDSTPLIKPLADYQWVDFRGVVQGHRVPHKALPATSSLVFAALTIVVVVAALFVSPLQSDPSATPSDGPGVLLALSVVTVLALVALIVRTYQRTRRARRATERLAEAIAEDLTTHGGGR